MFIPPERLINNELTCFTLSKICRGSAVYKAENMLHGYILLELNHIGSLKWYDAFPYQGFIAIWNKEKIN